MRRGGVFIETMISISIIVVIALMMFKMCSSCKITPNEHNQTQNEQSGAYTKNDVYTAPTEKVKAKKEEQAKVEQEPIKPTKMVYAGYLFTNHDWGVCTLCVDGYKFVLFRLGDSAGLSQMLDYKGNGIECK